MLTNVSAYLAPGESGATINTKSEDAKSIKIIRGRTASRTSSRTYTHQRASVPGILQLSAYNLTKVRLQYNMHVFRKTQFRGCGQALYGRSRMRGDSNLHVHKFSNFLVSFPFLCRASVCQYTMFLTLV